MKYFDKSDYFENANRKNIIIWFIVIFIVLFFIFRYGCDSNYSSDKEFFEFAEINYDTESDDTESDDTESDDTEQYYYPYYQSEFITIIENSKNDYILADNELKKSVIRTNRKNALKQHFATGRSVTNWLGYLSEMRTNSDGDAYIRIKINIGDNDMYIQTWNNSFSDFRDNTLIKQNSELYNTISNLKEGELVRFSGIFLNGYKDYLSEQSLTEKGSMTEPEFTFRFKSITNNLKIIENSDNEIKKETKINEDKSDSYYENQIKELLKAEDQRDFNAVVNYYDLKNIKRYWDISNPSYDDLSKAYYKSWKTTNNSSNKVISINKEWERIYDANLDFKFYHKTKEEWKTVNSTVRFVFGQNDKIIEVYGIEIKVLNQSTTSSYDSSTDFIKIGNQIWMTENLNVDKFRSGDPIPHAKTDKEWARAGEKKQPAWCYFDNDPANGEKYGKLYNWYAVNDPRGLAPEGWKIPSDAEWTQLTNYLGGEVVAGGKMKKTGTSHWESPNTGATNESGFSGLPGGYRYYARFFSGIGYYGYWWSSSMYSTSYAWYRDLDYSVGSAYRDHVSKESGLSVRCLRD